MSALLIRLCRWSLLRMGYHPCDQWAGYCFGSVVFTRYEIVEHPLLVLVLATIFRIPGNW